MKKIILSISLLIFSLSVFAGSDAAVRRSNRLLRFIAEHHGLRDAGLASVIKTRCNRYWAYPENELCKQAVKKMIAILDYDIIITDENFRLGQDRGQWAPSSFVFVAFKKSLINLLKSPATTTYLNDLNLQLYQFLTGDQEELNIWNLTKGHFQTDYLTSEVMATLFQDTSIMKLHLAYLERAMPSESKLFQTNKELLNRVIDTINLVLDSSEENYRSLFYPKEIQKDLNRNIYHFYVPLYLAKALEAEGYSKHTSSRTALMLTLSYEFVTASRDYRYFYADPDNITNPGKLKDIFGGYCGGKVGVRGMNFFKSFEAIRAAFERSTEDGVQLLLEN